MTFAIAYTVDNGPIIVLSGLTAQSLADVIIFANAHGTLTVREISTY